MSEVISSWNGVIASGEHLRCCQSSTTEQAPVRIVPAIYRSPQRASDLTMRSAILLLYGPNPELSFPSYTKSALPRRGSRLYYYRVPNGTGSDEEMLSTREPHLRALLRPVPVASTHLQLSYATLVTRQIKFDRWNKNPEHILDFFCANRVR